MIESLSTTFKVLLTAGPTHEAIDSVRYLANRSSGRLGMALAVESARRGHPTTLLLGPTHLSPPEPTPFHLLRFQSTRDLQELLREQWPQHDLLIMAAAVADFRPVNVELEGKIRRRGETLRLELEPTPDLLADLATLTRPGQSVIGFALEPERDLLESARDKLRRKKLDAIVANPLQTMEAKTIRASLLLRDGTMCRPDEELTKPRFAAWLFEHLDVIRQQAPRAEVENIS